MGGRKTFGIYCKVEYTLARLTVEHILRQVAKRTVCGDPMVEIDCLFPFLVVQVMYWKCVLSQLLVEMGMWQ